MEKNYELIKLPESLYNWINDVYTEKDWSMILSAVNGVIPIEQYSKEDIEKAYQRGVLNKVIADDEIKYVVATFDVRFECLIQCEKELWHSFSKEKIRAIASVMMDPERWLVERIKAIGEGKAVAETVSPVEDAVELINSSDGIITACQCNCNSYIQGCTRDKSNTCIHIYPTGNIPNTHLDRGNCKILTREEAVELVKQTDKDGLVHSLFNGKFKGMCNCCVCCCYNLMNRRNYPIKDYVLKTPFRAQIDSERCVKCGKCTKMCQFGAIQKTKEGKMNIDVDLCWGCGVCRNACTKKAILIYRRDISD